MTSILIVANVVVFIFQTIIDFYSESGYGFTRIFALSPEGLANGMLWQLITFQFLHAGLLHLIVNLLVIYFLGRAVEETLGEVHFLKLYLISGVAGGLLQVIGGWIIPKYFGGPVVGASAGALGLVAAFATLYPDRRLTVLLFFIIPFTMQAKYLLLFGFIISLLGILAPSSSVAHLAHLGGMLAGMGYIYLLIKKARRIRRSRSYVFKKPLKEMVGAGGAKKTFFKKTSPQDYNDADLPSEEFISREVDPILDKISKHGIHSLTHRERRILEMARNKMDRM